MFRKKRKYFTVYPVQETATRPEHVSVPAIPEGQWFKCRKCEGLVLREEFEKNLMVCPRCGKAGRMNARARVALVADADSFLETNPHLVGEDPLQFPGYEKKLKEIRSRTGSQEAVVTGYLRIHGIPVAAGFMDPDFIMGSMGSAVGEKLTALTEFATEKGLPLVIFSASGGARMQEGIISLMQMAKVSAALKRHGDAGHLYISVPTDPTTGGVTASFAMLGDIILSEPGSLIGFAGRRVIEGTIHKKLPEDFQSAEFLLEHGFLDLIVNRKDMKDTLHRLLLLHGYGV